MKVVTDVKIELVDGAVMLIVEVSHVEVVDGQIVVSRVDIIPTELPVAECDC